MNPDTEPFDPAAYADEISLPEAGKRELVRIMTSEPGRIVRSSPFNSSGRYWSRKNAAAIQFESRTMERPYIVQLEFDDEVVRYLDQPPIKITFVHEDPGSAAAAVTEVPTDGR